MRGFLLLAALAALPELPAYADPPAAEGDYQSLLAAGQADLRARNWADAAVHFRAATKVSEGAWDARLGLIDALIGGKRWGEARTMLEAAWIERPNDPAVLDRLGLASFWLDDLRASERAYRAALALKPDDLEAQSGLAWIAQRRGDVVGAREGFQAVLVSNPDHPAAREGLATVERTWRATFVGAGSVESFDLGHVPATGDDDRYTAPAYTLTVGADAVVRDSWVFSLRYRHDAALQLGGASGGHDGQSGPTDPNQSQSPDGLSNRGPGTAGFGQEEIHLAAGYDTYRWGAQLYLSGIDFHAASREAGSGTDATVGAMSARYRLNGWLNPDLGFSAVYGKFGGTPVRQFQLSATVPLWRSFSVFAAARSQYSNANLYLSGHGELQYLGEDWSGALGGSTGDQLHPADLTTHVIYNGDFLLRWRGYARVLIPLKANVAGTLAYEYEWYRIGTGHHGNETSDHRVSAGLNLSF